MGYVMYEIHVLQQLKSYHIVDKNGQSFLSFLQYVVLMASLKPDSKRFSFTCLPSPSWEVWFFEWVSPWPGAESTSFRSQEMNKFDDMMAYLHLECPHFLQVVAIDTHFMIFSRAWCVAELVQADASHLEQHMMIHSPGALEKKLWLQIFGMGVIYPISPPWNLT